MASSRVQIHGGNIRAFFQNRPLAGSGQTLSGGGSRGQAVGIAARMALHARINAAKFHQRTSSLVTSVVPIVRHNVRNGATEVGVGTTVEHGKWLEIGTVPHIIRSEKPFIRKGEPGYLLRSNTAKWIALKGEVPDGMELERAQNSVQHPGNIAYHWMSDAVRSVVPGRRVTVRVLK